MKIAIATVFLPRENIYWIEEWIRYHLFHIGVDAIYLYDNTGSQKLDHLPRTPEISVALSGKNLKGEDVALNTAHLSEGDVASIMNEIVLKYGGRVVVVPWHPVDEHGVPFYGQMQAYEHFLKQYGSRFDWVCLTDVDEFISNKNLIEKVSLYMSQGYNDIIVHPKLFMQRFSKDGPIIPALSITDYIVGTTDRYWKRIVKCSEAVYPCVHLGGRWKGKWKPAFITGLTFHHYKVGPWGYQRMRDEIALCPKVLKVGTDESLKDVIPTLSLENNVFIPPPKKVSCFRQGPRKIVLPSVSLGTKIIVAKRYFVIYTIFRFRLIGDFWYDLKGRDILL